MRAKAFIIVSCVLLRGVSCLGLTKDNSIGAACVYVANNLTLYPFDCEGLDLDYSCRCRDPSFLGTVLVCIDDQAETADTVTSSYHYAMEICKLQARQTYKFVDLVSIFSNATKHLISVDDASAAKVLRNPVLPNRELYEVSIASINSLMTHRLLATFFGIACLGFWGIIVVIGMINNMGVWCVPSIKMGFNGRFSKWIQKHLTIPQLFSRNTNKRRKTRLGQWTSILVRTFPTRLDSIVIGGYFFIILVFCLVDYNIAYPNTLFRYRSCGALVYIADRAGIIAITQLPLMFLFAGRNNVLMFITGWSYRSFNIYHRWISRFVWILIVIHGLCYVGYSRQNNDYKSRWALEKWRWANTATIGSGIAVILSFRPIRKFMYETFKICHQLLAILFVVGVWNHCKTLGWMEFVYATVAIWAFDHAVRLGKVIVSGGVVIATCEAIMEAPEEEVRRNMKGGEGGGGGEMEAEVSSISNEEKLRPIGNSADVKDDDQKTTNENAAQIERTIYRQTRPPQVHSIRVTISHSGWWRDFPGCYVFLYFLRPTVFWQSHPFTLIESSSKETVDQLNMVIRVKQGITRHIADYIASQENRIARIPVLVEGPYGTPIAFRNYQNAVFVAAGVGLTIVYTLAVDLARQYRADVLRGDYSEDEHHITVVWVTPTVKTLEVCLSEIESMAATPEINLKVYITRDRRGEKTSGYFDEDGDKPVSQRVRRLVDNEVAGVRVVLGRRPEIKQQLVKQVERHVGHTAIIACGPDAMNRDARAAAGKWLKTSSGRAGETGGTSQKVDYFEEELLW